MIKSNSSTNKIKKHSSPSHKPKPKTKISTLSSIKLTDSTPLKNSNCQNVKNNSPNSNSNSNKNNNKNNPFSKPTLKPYTHLKTLSLEKKIKPSSIYPIYKIDSKSNPSSPLFNTRSKTYKNKHSNSESIENKTKYQLFTQILNILFNLYSIFILFYIQSFYKLLSCFQLFFIKLEISHIKLKFHKVVLPLQHVSSYTFFLDQLIKKIES